MPHEIVANHLHLAVEAELHVAVLRLEYVTIGGGMDGLKFEQILRTDLVELLGDDFDTRSIGAVTLSLINRDANHHALRHEFLERHVLTRHQRRDNDGSCRDCSQCDQPVHRFSCAGAPLAFVSNLTAMPLTGLSSPSRNRAQKSVAPPALTIAARITFGPFFSVSRFDTPSSITVCRSL